ncbi:polymorphic toxin-type HINT domain-containing protein [Kitasatospora sp. NPDC091207]|uniref:polymorphic toxin-type HINT domain-containing protein n=1 Tax=Kitasatospora sp. NPDC091207 TaxID=3364083 RepID=UPI00380B9C4A
MSAASAVFGAKLTTLPLRELEKQSIPCRNSFPSETMVLMADGSTKPIGDIQPGDSVTTAYPQSGNVDGKPVTAEIVTPNDTQFTELSIAVADSGGSQASPKSVVSTSHHPYWDATSHRWTAAEEIEPGHELTTPDNRTAVVITVRSYATPPQTAENLSVADLHAYFVIAGDTPVLAHNCPTPAAGTTSQ